MINTHTCICVYVCGNVYVCMCVCANVYVCMCGRRGLEEGKWEYMRMIPHTTSMPNDIGTPIPMAIILHFLTHNQN